MRQEIIGAIQNQEWLHITFRRVKDDNYVSRVVAPYDVFTQESGEHRGKERLIGYTKAHEDYQPGIISLYLTEISSIQETGGKFDGPAIRRLIDPKRPPHIPRDW